MNLETLKQLDKKYAIAIADYLLKRIEEDQFLKEKLETTEKTLKGCVEYCKQEARKQAEDNVAIIKDDEVYEWCVHYFLEDSLNCETKAQEKKTSSENKIEKKETNQPKEVADKENQSKEVAEENKKKKNIKNKLFDQLSLFDL